MFEGQNRRSAMNKRVKLSSKEKKVQRPCRDCRWFRLLDAGGRYGVCDKREKPSDPRECVVYKKKEI